jgi:hypothetical protein
MHIDGDRRDHNLAEVRILPEDNVRHPSFHPGWRNRFHLAILAIVLALPGVAFCQFSSSIEGTVTEQSGAVVPAATIELRSLDTGVVRTATSGTDGIYHFVSLGAGRYEAKATAKGFAAAAVTIELVTGQTLNLPILLHVGTVSQAIVVTDHPPTLDTAETRTEATIGEEAIETAPLASRSVFPLMADAPGAVGLGTDLDSKLGTSTANFGEQMTFDLSANGRGPNGNMFVLDGLDVTSVVCDGCVNMEPNPDSIQEISVQSNTFSVEYGRASGLEVAMTTKAGTDEYHGDVDEIYNYQGLWAGTEFVHKYAPFHTNNGSAAMGGPILRKNNLFFFASAEILRSLSATGNTSITYEDPAFVSWAKTNFPATVGTQLLTKYPASLATTTSVAKTAANVFPTTCGTPATANLPCTTPMIDNGIFNASDYTNGEEYNVRIDKYFSKDRLYGSYYRMNNSFGGPSARPANATTNPISSQAVQADETHPFSSRLLNEAEFGFDRPFGNTQATGDLAIPGITITGISTGYTFTGVEEDYAQPNYHWRDVLTLVRGAHTLMFGYDGTRGDEYDWRSATYGHPNFTFTNLLNVVEDNPYSETQLSYSPTTGQPSPGIYFRTTYLGSGFAQDSWKATSRLSLTYGLRWDEFGNPFHHSMPALPGNFYLGAGATWNEKVANGSVIQTSHLLAHAPSAFSPRIGFAYDLTGNSKWVVRGGAGVYHDWLTLGASSDGVSTNPPAFLVPTFLTGTTTPPIFVLGTSNTYPFGFPYPTLTTVGLNAQGGVVGDQLSITGTDPNVRASEIYIYTATLERALGHAFSASVGYDGSRGTGLVTDSDQNAEQSFGTDINRFAGDLIENNDVLHRLNPSFGSIKYSFNQSTSRYNALILSLRGDVANKGFISANYTRSTSWDDANQYPTPLILPSQDWGPSPENATNHFSLLETYFIPSVSGDNQFARRVTGGWDISGNTILQSGYPFSVYTSAQFEPIFNATHTAVIGEQPGGGDYNGDGDNYSYPNVTSYSQPHNRQAYLKGLFPSSQFTTPTLGTEGNEASDRFTGPGFAQTDIVMRKNNNFLNHDRMNLQLRFEFYNIFNRPNLWDGAVSATNGVVGDLSNASFGKATAQHSPRYIQFGGRLTF